MKLLLIPWGRGMGHLTRCLAIAKEVARHYQEQISIVAEDRWATLIEQIGCKRETFPQELTALGPWEKWDEVSHVKRSLAADLHLLEIVKPDIVIHDARPTMPIACELADIPCVTLAQCDMFPGFLFPGETQSVFWSDKLPAFKQVLNECGLQPLNDDLRELFFRHPVLIPSVPDFDPLSTEANEMQVYTGPLLFSSGNNQHTSVLNEKSELPTIFVYGVIRGQYDLDQLLTIFGDMPFHFLIAALPADISIDKQKKKQLHVTLSPFIDVPTILPKCAAAIIHGGHGSCMALLTSGIPAVVLPCAAPSPAERIFNGGRLEAMGVARSLPGEIRWDKVREEIELVTQDPVYRVNALKWQKYLRQWAGPQTAWEMLTKLVSGTR